MTTLVPIAFECDETVSIWRCAVMEVSRARLPEFWYIRRPASTMAEEEIGWDREWIKRLKAAGITVAYWGGEKWWHHTPKQFDTPEDAWREWDAKSRVR